MFDIHFLVDDAKVAKVLHALDGMALNLEVRPVRQAAPAKNGKVLSTAPDDPISAAHAFLKDRGALARPSDIQDAAVHVGFKRGSYSYLVRKLEEAQALSHNGGSGVKSAYKVMI